MKALSFDFKHLSTVRKVAIIVNLVAIGVIVMLLLFGCTTNIHHADKYKVTGSHDVTDMQQAFDDLDIPGDVTNVVVESIRFEITTNSVFGYGNTIAVLVDLNMRLNNWHDVDYAVLKSYLVKSEKSTQTFYRHDRLNKPAIVQIHEIMFDIVNHNELKNMTVINSTFHETSFPADVIVNARIKMFVKVAVEYSREDESRYTLDDRY
jgi:hypothetical protein